MVDPVRHRELPFEGTGAPSERRTSRLPNGGQSFQSVLEETIDGRAKKGTRPVDRRLMDACVEMESLFVARMLKEMRKTVHKGEWMHGGFAEEVFEDLLYDEYAMTLSKTSNLGLAKLIYSELSRK